MPRQHLALDHVEHSSVVLVARSGGSEERLLHLGHEGRDVRRQDHQVVLPPVEVDDLAGEPRLLLEPQPPKDLEGRNLIRGDLRHHLVQSRLERKVEDLSGQERRQAPAPEEGVSRHPDLPDVAHPALRLPVKRRVPDDASLVGGQDGQDAIVVEVPGPGLDDPGPRHMFDDRVYKRGALTLHGLSRRAGMIEYRPNSKAIDVD